MGFKSIYKTAVGATALQIMVSVSVMLMLGPFSSAGEPERAILYGFVLALSSTAVGIKILEDIGELRNETGRIAVGVLIAQDLAVVPMLIIVVRHVEQVGHQLHRRCSLKIALAVPRPDRPDLVPRPEHRIHLPLRGLLVRYPDLAPIAALALCVIGAAVSSALQLSAGLGAFLAGSRRQQAPSEAPMVRAMEPIQEPAADDVLPLGRPADRPSPSS